MSEVLGFCATDIHYRLFLTKTVPGTREKEKKKGTYLSSCVGADIYPGLSGIEPEDACGPLGVVGQHDWDSTVKGHRVIQLILEHIQVVEPIWIAITETGKHTLRLDPMQ